MDFGFMAVCCGSIVRWGCGGQRHSNEPRWHSSSRWFCPGDYGAVSHHHCSIRKHHLASITGQFCFNFTLELVSHFFIY